MRLRNFFQTTHSALLQLLTRATECGRSVGGCNFGNILPINILKCYWGKIHVFWWKQLSKLFEFYYMGPGLDIRDFVDTMNTRNQERHNHSEDCIIVKASRKTQIVQIYRSKKESVLAFVSKVAFLVAMLARNSEWCWKEENFTNQSLLTTLFTYTFSWCTRTRLGKKLLLTRRPIAALIFIISKLKVGDIICTAQYITYWAFSKLQFRQPLKNFFQSIPIDLRDTSGVNIPFAIVAITRFVSMYRKASNLHF